MWQFAEAVRGLADGCLELGIPVTGGNVSFYNQTGAAAIHPTPVVGVLGVLDNVADRVPMGFVPRAGGDHDQLFLLGETHVELSGSEWAWVTHEHLGGMPPQVDLAREQALAELLAEAARVGSPQLRARPLRRWPGPEPGRVLPAATASVPGSRCRSSSPTARCRSSTCSASPPARVAGLGAARPREGVHGALRRARRAVRADRRHRPGRRRAGGARPVPDRPGRAARRAHRDAAAPVRRRRSGRGRGRRRRRAGPRPCAAGDRRAADGASRPTGAERPSRSDRRTSRWPLRPGSPTRRCRRDRRPVRVEPSGRRPRPRSTAAESDSGAAEPSPDER